MNDDANTILKVYMLPCCVSKYSSSPSNNYIPGPRRNHLGRGSVCPQTFDLLLRHHRRSCTDVKDVEHGLPQT